MYSTNELNHHKQKRRIVILTVGFIVVLAVSSFLFIAPGRENSPATTGNSFTGNLVEQDSGTAYEMLSSDFKEQLNEEAWREWVSFIFESYDGKTPQLVEAQVIENLGNAYGADANPHRLVYEFEFENQVYILPLILIQEDGLWRVNEIGSFKDG